MRRRSRLLIDFMSKVLNRIMSIKSYFNMLLLQVGVCQIQQYRIRVQMIVLGVVRRRYIGLQCEQIFISDAAHFSVQYCSGSYILTALKSA